MPPCGAQAAATRTDITASEYVFMDAPFRGASPARLDVGDKTRVASGRDRAVLRLVFGGERGGDLFHVARQHVVTAACAARCAVRVTARGMRGGRRVTTWKPRRSARGCRVLRRLRRAG